MTYWLTTYRGIRGNTFYSTIQADSFASAEDAASRRGLREIVVTDYSGKPVDAQRCSEFLRKERKALRRVHAVIYLCLLAVQSGVMNTREVLDDEGLLHQWIHLELYKGKRPTRRRHREILPSRTEMLRRVKDVERKIPGYPQESR